MTASHCCTETVFDYTWKQVVQAYWNRYPNPSSAHVLTEDTISREIRDGKLYSRRILSKTNHVPKWGERFYKNTPIKIIEDSVLDPKKKILTTFTRNIGYKKIMKVDEIVEYSEQKDGRTLAVRRAYISSQVFGFSRAIRAFGIERFKSNCQKTANGFNYVLTRMFPNHKFYPAPAATTKTTKTTKIMTLKQQKQSTPVGRVLESSNASIKFTEQCNTIAALQTHHHQQQQQQQQSKTESVKKALKYSYTYFKGQVIKIAQMFSVKN